MNAESNRHLREKKKMGIAAVSDPLESDKCIILYVIETVSKLISLINRLSVRDDKYKIILPTVSFGLIFQFGARDTNDWRFGIEPLKQFLSFLVGFSNDTFGGSSPWVHLMISLEGAMDRLCPCHLRTSIRLRSGEGDTIITAVA
jgi:hypothetical protein